eukprot:TRINITY_DN5280_c0_g1_i2.p1 TRINITY_DN5280_c0_g1~~TRINITY_DN5280_c0_g1_i2.p1  ORF type:complete len:168 (+),score=62.66 TRINITY_DN5280_c0_g1_i2:256-759(+)
MSRKLVALSAAAVLAVDALRGWYNNTQKLRDFPKQLARFPWHFSGALITFPAKKKKSGQPGWFKKADTSGKWEQCEKFIAKCTDAGLSVCDLDTKLCDLKTVCVAASFVQLLAQAESGTSTDQIQKRVAVGPDRGEFAVVTKSNLAVFEGHEDEICLLYTSPSPRDS